MIIARRWLLLLLLIGICMFSSQGSAYARFESSLQQNPILKDVDVMIDVGHGGVDSGTHLGTIYEKDINLAIALKVYEELKARGYRVMMNRDGDYALSTENQWLRISSRHIKDLAQRTHLANEIHPKLLISIHVNTAGSTRKSGPLLLHQKTEESKRLAKELQQALNQLYGAQETPKYGKTYYLLKHSKCPSVIVEVGYLSNPSDRQRMLKPAGQKDIAERISDGVQRYLEEKKPG
ncbi:N-acetylmuramoyl-L-alanine amidase [Paenibacillus sp. GD4]|uniref:N-acetylmuramoyl-L-alanine amidase family protein n=1 Tax=Paenibacillus sp. GD4 TaxID=3068890 RepID=UPI002796782B|nr:N-acetylmuramoyl-L-alanine amidase [Paenibacillus sp. GD4]MDQ1912363.1 N-acetylmuramoyl-L-alanine amidase [Paenibacillus sp. GD4]